jgi:dTDP-4-dehydrorhamnose reductase
LKAIVIGVDGGIGRALTSALSARGDSVIGTTRRAADGIGDLIHLDLAGAQVETVSLPRADVAIICAAMTGLAECRRNPRLSRQVNTVAPALIARRLTDAGTRVVFISTNAVYDWQSPLVPASRPTTPSTIYGEQKADAEATLASMGQAVVILRLTKVLTPDLALFNGWIKALRAGETVQAFTDMHLAPVTLDDAVNALLALAGSKESGIFQISGSRDISYADAARHLARCVGAPLDLVAETEARNLGFPQTEITTFSSLSSARYSQLTGWVAPDPLASIEAVFGPAMSAAREMAQR